MKDSLKILCYFLGVLILGALIAPPLYWGGQWLGGWAPGMDFLRETDFQRYFNRAMLVAAVALLWPVIRWLNIGGWRELGLGPNPAAKNDALVGLLLGCLPLLLLGFILVQLEVYRWKYEIPWGAIGKISLTAITVALIEEFFFRGALLGIVRRSASTITAVLFVSALFSILHFLKPREGVIAPGEIGWLSGFALVPHAFHQFADPMLVLSGFLTLFAVGLILAWATVETRSLWLPIALHAGWILGLKTFSKFTKRINRDTLPWTGENLLIGLVPLCLLIITAFLLWLYLRRRKEHGAAR